jgi:hypothetical protein
LEARVHIDESGTGAPQARRFLREQWHELQLHDLKLAPNVARRPPREIAALLQHVREPGTALSVAGEVTSFVMLSRPGPAQTRIVTSLGFARFGIGDLSGAGMFERSDRSSAAPGASGEAAEDIDES